ncbi:MULTISPECIES: DUF4177 domain-containing protein [unclassified Clostridium]|uniref:DUF4177 domain-containing protein n=1 Tax=unclassified Clostridium TaxID=2614128 RepID=UPI000297DE8C|nr:MULTISPECIES: DUF4177 domain-containing protein [unclassified Clostridium]EKQ57448.1 MAG: hypothetical protein A370_00820 [Clostridium sp. Maddingley MBC34-26]
MGNNSIGKHINVEIKNNNNVLKSEENLMQKEFIKNIDISAKERKNDKFKGKTDWFKLSLIALIIIFISITMYGIKSIKSSIGINQEQKWEYKTMKILPETSNSRTGEGSANINTITPSEEQLNELGGDGWELVSSYLEMETAYPNFGNDKYVTGLQPNVRPQRLVLLLKRPVKGK